jgi:hypothetical protein
MSLISSHGAPRWLVLPSSILVFSRSSQNDENFTPLSAILTPAMVRGMRLALFIDYFKFQKLVMVVAKELRMYIICSLARVQMDFAIARNSNHPRNYFADGPIRFELSTSL